MRIITIGKFYVGLLSATIGWSASAIFEGKVTPIDIGGWAMVLVIAIILPFWSQKIDSK